MRRLSKLGVICSLQLFLTVGVVHPAGAQVPNGSSSANPPAAHQTRPPVTKNEIKVRANEVIVPVTVLDRQHEPVLDLSKADFHVFDGGVEQKIDRWDLDGDPLAVALLIETSTHIKSMATTIHRLASIFTENIMALDGQAAVITYDSDVNVRQTFTQDHDLIEKAIEKVPFEASETQLYDGMARGVALLKEQPPNRHRVLLVVGESADSGSEAKLGQVLRDAELANVSIYTIGVTSVGINTSANDILGGKLPPLKLSKHAPPISAQRPGNATIWKHLYGLYYARNLAHRARYERNQESPARSCCCCYGRCPLPGIPRRYGSRRARQNRRPTLRTIHHELYASPRMCNRAFAISK